MKNDSAHKNLPSLGWWRTFTLILVALWMTTAQGMAQDSTAVATEEEEKETILKSKMSLTASQFPDGTIQLNGLLRAKIEGSYQKVTGKKVGFFLVDDEANEKNLGNADTKVDGIASVTVKTADLAPGAAGTYSFLARYDGDEAMNGSESDLMVRSARLEMELNEADSVYTVRLKATADSKDGPVPIAAAPVAVYVKRMFSSLKVAEGETDEEGVVELEFPVGLAGDQDGNLNITAKIEETEEYGNLEASAVQKWGTPVSYEIRELPEALWSGHPPVWMIITFFVLMGMVWGNYIVIVFNLFRIKAEKQ